MFYTYAYCDPNQQSDILSDFDCEFLPFYIGYGQGNRHLSHMSLYHTSNEKKSNPIKCSKIKRLVEKGQLPVIKILKQFESKSDAVQHEISLILSIGTIAKVLGVNIRGPLSNLHKGGNGGHIPKTVEGKKAISEKMKGREITQEWRDKISKAKKGRSFHSDETLKLISEKTSEALLSNPEALAKISAAHLGKPKSKSHRDKLIKHLQSISATSKEQGRLKRIGQSRTAEQIENISLTTKEAMSNPKIIAKMKKSSKLRWRDPAERKKIADKNSKIFHLTHKETGQTLIVKNLAAYCRENKTHHRKMHLEFRIIPL